MNLTYFSFFEPSSSKCPYTTISHWVCRFCQSQVPKHRICRLSFFVPGISNRNPVVHKLALIKECVGGGFWIHPGQIRTYVIVGSCSLFWAIVVIICGIEITWTESAQRNCPISFTARGRSAPGWYWYSPRKSKEKINPRQLILSLHTTAPYKTLSPALKEWWKSTGRQVHPHTY